jgi:hypothetical protein
MCLGRNLWLDARSLAFMVENNVEEMGKSLRSREWERVLAILDQGQLGSCTGNAGAGALGTQPLYDACGRNVLPSPDDAARAEEFAVQLYSDATRVDAYLGEYPPDDTGSSGLAICKVFKARGTVTRYRWARNPYGLLRLLQNGPVLQGMPWYTAFFEPDGDGYIDSNSSWPSSGLAGGPRSRGCRRRARHARRLQQHRHLRESWGTSWGDAGRFRMRLRTYEQLDGVDLKQLIA